MPIMSSGVKTVSPLWLTAMRLLGGAAVVSSVMAATGRLSLPPVRRPTHPAHRRAGATGGGVPAGVFRPDAGPGRSRASIVVHTAALWVAAGGGLVGRAGRPGSAFWGSPWAWPASPPSRALVPRGPPERHPRRLPAAGCLDSHRVRQRPRPAVTVGPLHPGADAAAAGSGRLRHGRPRPGARGCPGGRVDGGRRRCGRLPGRACLVARPLEHPHRQSQPVGDRDERSVHGRAHRGLASSVLLQGKPLTAAAIAGMGLILTAVGSTCMPSQRACRARIDRCRHVRVTQRAFLSMSFV